jgi:GH43 family beta-xylosidase
MSKPLVTNIYTADPSAHIFEGKIYIYPSHDLDHDNVADDTGDQYDMEDVHVFSMENATSSPIDHGEVLHLKDIPWAKKQLWAPDAAFKNDTYYLYFAAKDKQDIFRIGVATSKSPVDHSKRNQTIFQEVTAPTHVFSSMRMDKDISFLAG